MKAPGESCAPHVRNFWTMPKCDCRNVPMARTSQLAPTAPCTATNQLERTRPGRSCGMPAHGCYCAILFSQLLTNWMAFAKPSIHVSFRGSKDCIRERTDTGSTPDQLESLHIALSQRDPRLSPYHYAPCSPLFLLSQSGRSIR